MVKYNIVELTDMDLPRLQTIATDLGLTDIKGVEKQALIYQILDRQAESVAGMQKEKEAQKSEQKRRGPGRPPKNKSAESAAEASAAEKEPKADTAEKAESKPAKRRPGRPKKNKAAEPTEAAAPAKAEPTEAETKEEAEAAESKPAKRRPGRPKKSKSAAAPVAETPASIAETEPILATEPMLEAEEMPVEAPVAAPIAPVSPVVPPSAAPETTPQTAAAVAHEAKPSPEVPTATPATPPAPEEPKRTIFKHATDTPSVLDQVLPMQPPAPQPKDKQQNEAKKRPQQNHRPNNPNLRENAPVHKDFLAAQHDPRRTIKIFCALRRLERCGQQISLHAIAYDLFGNIIRKKIIRPLISIYMRQKVFDHHRMDRQVFYDENTLLRYARQ